MPNPNYQRERFCQKCGNLIPSYTVSTRIAYGKSTDLCSACRHEEHRAQEYALVRAARAKTRRRRPVRGRA